MDIRLLEKSELPIILPLVQLLNPNTEEEILLNRLNEMAQTNYECVGVFVEGNLVGIAGLWLLTKLYNGRHLEPDNVIISQEYQGKGLGKLLFEWINQYALSKGCEVLELNCYVHNSPAHKFWMNEGYKILGYHFQKNLNEL
ncbi:MAG: GNAT family N-acetyltransferase [Bacteroidia bacterium]|nr:GNAT family N-acetyltransferase [Bacteroidia bacterium]